MRLYTNESVSVAVAEGLKRRGVEALSARDAGNLGLTDEQQLAYAQALNMVLFTHDEDFLKIAHERLMAGQPHSGIIYVHQQKLSLGEMIRRLKVIAELLTEDDFLNHIEFL
jgi:predicted nuclease of predicted toxin-antitoxin system